MAENLTRRKGRPFFLYLTSFSSLHIILSIFSHILLNNGIKDDDKFYL